MFAAYAAMKRKERVNSISFVETASVGGGSLGRVCREYYEKTNQHMCGRC
jgi:hypothetical protein